MGGVIVAFGHEHCEHGVWTSVRSFYGSIQLSDAYCEVVFLQDWIGLDWSASIDLAWVRCVALFARATPIHTSRMYSATVFRIL